MCIYPISRTKNNLKQKYISGFYWAKLSRNIVFAILNTFLLKTWPKIAFYPIKLQFFIIGVLISSKKTNVRLETLIFWQKILDSITRKVKKDKPDITKFDENI